MFDILYPPPAERVVISALLTPSQDKDLFEEDIQEMVMLCRTAGADVVDTVVQRMHGPHAASYLGKGKLASLGRVMREKNAKTLVVDAELSPGQVRTIESLVDGKVIDRSQLILDIFAQHARTNEARVQVELAQLRTLYPRLTHAWSHFSKQVGGIGTRGPGEKQLEVDRRLVQRKIADLKIKLKKVERSRRTQRRSRAGEIRLALVGYTNVGKSSLLNALSGSELLVENKLFATLDTATRRIYISGIGEVLVSDTVGFLRKLPHHLVASFKSTLEVVSEADLLLIVLDASSMWNAHQLATVDEVLRELGAADIARILVHNKSDLVTDPFEAKQIGIDFPDAMLVSAFNSDDMRVLKTRIADALRGLASDRAMSEIILRHTKVAAENP